jgi:hypothetical protein
MKSVTRSLALVSLIILMAAGCASSGSAGKAAPSRRSSDLITREQIDASNRANAFELVQAMRPNWLIKRGAQTINLDAGDIVVYYGGSRLGSPTSLRDLSLPSIEFLQFVPGPAASQRWGLDHSFGVIFVSPRGTSARPSHY